jgi:hypothetical protein
MGEGTYAHRCTHGGPPKPHLIVQCIELTISSLRQAGVYDHAITTWDDKELADQTWTNFQLHFDKQEKL